MKEVSPAQQYEIDKIGKLFSKLRGNIVSSGSAYSSRRRAEALHYLEIAEMYTNKSIAKYDTED